MQTIRQCRGSHCLAEHGSTELVLVCAALAEPVSRLQLLRMRRPLVDVLTVVQGVSLPIGISRQELQLVMAMRIIHCMAKVIIRFIKHLTLIPNYNIQTPNIRIHSSHVFANLIYCQGQGQISKWSVFTLFTLGLYQKIGDSMKLYGFGRQGGSKRRDRHGRR